MEKEVVPSHFRGLLRIFRDSFRLYPWQSFSVVCLVIISGFSEALGLLTVLPILNYALNPDQNDISAQKINDIIQKVFGFIHVEPALHILLIIIVLMITIKSLTAMLSNSYVGYMTARIATDLRLSLIESLFKASWQFFSKQPTGRLTNAMTQEASRSSSSYLAAWSMISAGIQLLIFLIASGSISREILVAGFVVGGLIAVFLGWAVKLSRRAGAKETELMNSLTSVLNDSVSGIKPLKAMGLEGNVHQLLQADAKTLNAIQVRHSIATAAQGNLSEPLVIAVLAIVAYFALTSLEIDFAVFGVMALFFTRMMGRVSQLQKYYQMLGHSQSAYWSLKGLIQNARDNQEIMPPPTDNVPSFQKKISFKNVCFSYDINLVHQDLNLDIPKNKITLLTGASGSGKTTTIDLVTGLLQPGSGQILLDDVPLTDINTQNWRSQIGYVPQEVFLFHDTLRNNIGLLDQNISDNDIWKALEESGAKDFVNALPEKLDTVLGERGSRLSGGQRQRIMIARALVRKPALLILDEATTALDPKTEQEICETIVSLSTKTTILAISHQKAISGIAHVVIDLGKLKKAA